MKKKYNSWIKMIYPTSELALNQCYQACELMIKNFPELIKTNGLIQVGIEKDMRPHWWLKTRDGEIVDPTSHQYKMFGLIIVFYQEIDDSHDLRNYRQAKCCHCGEKYFVGKDNWNNYTVCSQSCYSDFAKSLK